jgi:pilus assembly protein FimV
VAKINPVKVKQDAEKEEKAGRFDKAIDLYRQLVQDNPRDWNTIKKIGDLYARMNRTREATQEYSKVADFYERDGFLLKAIALWKQIQKQDASEIEPYHRLAALYAKQGLLVEAKGQYQIIVDEYKKRGKFREVGDALRKMAEIDPTDLKLRSMLAELYLREGNPAKAVEEQIAIADELGKKGHLSEALQVLEKGLKADPKSGRLAAEVAKIHLLQKNYERAAQFLEDAVRHAPNDAQVLARLGEAYLGAKRVAEAEKIFRKLLQLDPRDQDTLTQMGRVFLAQGAYDQAYEQFAPVVDKLIERKEGDKAATLLNQIVQRNQAHVKSLVKLVEIYRVLRKEPAVAATYSQLVEAYINQGEMDQAASVLGILVGMEPTNEQHRTKLDFVRGKTGGRPAAPPASAPPPGGDFFEEDLDLAASEDVPALDLDAPPAPAPLTKASGRATIAIELSPPPSEDDKEFIDEHLAEGRVFRKYGLVDKSADQFEAIVGRFPDHLEARQELRDIYKEKGENDKAAEQCLAMAEICRLKGDTAGADAHTAEAAALVPSAATPAAPARVASAITPPAGTPVPRPAAPPRAAAPPPAAEEEEISLEVEEAGLETEAMEEPAGEELDLGLDGGQQQEELSGSFVDIEEESRTAPVPAAPAAVPEDDIPLGFVEEEPAPEPPPPPRPSPPVLKAAASPTPAAKPAASPARPASRIVPKPAKAPPPPPPSLVAKKGPLVAKPTPAPAAQGVPPELQRAIDEVESYVSLGFVDDARDALSEIAAKYPGHPALAPKLAELGLDGGGAPAPSPKKATPPRAAARPAPAAPPRRERPPIEEQEGLGGLEGLENLAPESLVQEPPTIDEAPPAEEPRDLLGGGDFASSSPPMEDPLGELDLGAPEAPEPEASSIFGSERGGFGEPGSLEETEGALGADEGFAGSGAFGGGAGLEDSADLGESAGYTEPGGLDLDAELGDLFGAQSAVAEPTAAAVSELGDAGLADIFKEFKKGVDKQLGKEDYDTRYNLGIAYKEMGLIDEAIAEFQLAAKDEGRLLECSSMLGICFLEKGMAKLAVKWFEKGLSAPGRTDEEYQGLRYDLATALEAAGETDKALTLFTDLYGQDANFRDVATKVRELRAALR